MGMGISKIGAALALLVSSALADPFTGRYLVESLPDAGVSVSGYIDFVNAPMGTTALRLGDAFVVGWQFVVSGPGF